MQKYLLNILMITLSCFAGQLNINYNTGTPTVIEFSEIVNIEIVNAPNNTIYDFIRTFGDEQLNFPGSISIGKDSILYVSDVNNNRIAKFAKSGTFLGNYISCNSPRSMLFLDNKIVILKSGDNKVCELNYNNVVINEWGGSGTENGQFNRFRQLTKDNENNLYIVDHNNHRIQKFDSNNNFLLKWGSNGSTPGDFIYPWGIAYLNDKIIVSSEGKVQFFTKSGTFIKEWSFGSSQVHDLRVKGNDIYLVFSNYVLKTNENRDYDIKIGESYLQWATGVEIDSNDDVYIVDTYAGVSLFRMRR